MLIGVAMVACGAYVVRHAWRWALAPASPVRIGVMLQGGRPVELPCGIVAAQRIARWAAWAYRVPCAALVSTDTECVAVTINPDGSEGRFAILRPRHA